MEILLYLIKSTALLSLFFLIYEFLLKRDTFFALNRIYLFSGIVAAALLPLLTFSKTIVVEEKLVPVNTLSKESLVSHTFPSEAMFVENTSFWSSIDYAQILIYLYLLGVVFFLIKFAISLWKLRGILKHRPNSYQKDGIRYIETDLKTNPFTFFKTVVYNPNLHRQDELEMILHHERTHARNWHSLDILLGQLLIAFHWFNPLVWLYSKRIDQNLEFIADYKTTEKQFPKRSYQLSLLRTAIPNHLSLPVNNFHSFTKIRILMLNKNKSRHINRLKVLIVMPFIMVFLMSFQVETITQIKTSPSSQIESDSISNPEVDLLKSMLKNYDEDTVLSFNGKKMTIKEIVPSLYKVKVVKYDAQGIPSIQAQIQNEETLKLQLKNMSEGLYLQVSENSNLAIIAKNDAKTNDSVTVLSSDKKQDSKDDKVKKETVVSDNVLKVKEVQSNPHSNISREDLALARKKSRDSLKNRSQEIQFDVQYELGEGNQKQRKALERERHNKRDSIRLNSREINVYEIKIENGRNKTLGDSLRISEEALKKREYLRQQRQIEKEKRSKLESLESLEVFVEEDHDRVIMVNFGINEHTSDAHFDQIVSKFAEVGVDFNYKVVKRNQEGKITKIRMTLNNRKGSQSKVNNQSSSGIGSYILGFNEGGSIYIRKIN